MKLIDINKQKKFFNILNKLERGYSIDPLKNIYKGYDKTNPDRLLSQKEVFVLRTINKWLNGKYLILYKTSSTNIEYKQYCIILNISYYNTRYGNDKIKVQLLDVSKPYDIFTDDIFSFNDILRLEGEWCDDPTVHNNLLETFMLSISEKEFIFEAYDYSKFIKRKDKNKTVDDMKSNISIFAKTEKEAYKKKEEFQKTSKSIILSDIIEIK